MSLTVTSEAGRRSRRADGQLDCIRLGPGAAGIERSEVHLRGRPFAPHRHDTYAIGITLTGVLEFHFRGDRWHCLPGQCHVLHPDEPHDGAAGTDTGVRYCMLHLDPWLIQQALRGRALPFLPRPVLDRTLLQPNITRALWDIEAEFDEIARIDLISIIAELLLAAASRPANACATLPLADLLRVRECIAAHPEAPHAMVDMERLAGLDRWTLARQFRAAFGTSPSRFRTLRQLDAVRRSLESGADLAQAAACAGFADQSHMSRQFKRAYGLTPAQWAASLA